MNACIIIAGAVSTSLVLMIALKALHDFVRPRRSALVQRHIEVAGRIMALYVGTVAVEMIMQGVRAWVKKF